MKTIGLKIKLLALTLLSAFSNNAQSYGEIRGVVTNASKEPIPFAVVKILQGNLLVGGTQTDLEGRYQYKPLTPGTYEMIVLEPGHITQPINKIRVVPNDAVYVDVTLQINLLGTVTVTAKPIDYTHSGVDITVFHQISVDAKELNNNSGYTRGDVKGALEYLSADIISNGGREVHFRGARDGAAGYFVDGVRTLELNYLPGLCIENLSVFPGGVPAMYGDLGSGVVMITTKSYFSGLREKNIRRSEILGDR